MTRSKLRLEYITNNAMRKATFKKRRGGFVKKLTELTTLCGVEACAIIYSTYDSQPDVWPSPSGAQQAIYRYSVVPDVVQKKKAMSHESFIKQRTMAINQRVEKMRRVNTQKQTELLVLEHMYGLEYLGNLPQRTMSDVARQIDKNLMAIKKRMQDMEKEEAKNEQVYRPELPPPLARQPSDSVNYLSPENGVNQNMYLGREEEELHLAFADINQEENAFWTRMFP